MRALNCLVLGFGLLSAFAGTSPVQAGSVRVIDPNRPSYCADMKQITQFGNVKYNSIGTACSQSDGSWEIIPDGTGSVNYIAQGIRAAFVFTPQTSPDMTLGQCQNFTQSTRIGFTMQHSKGQACAQTDGTWTIQKTNAQNIRYKTFSDHVYLLPLTQQFQLDYPHTIPQQ